MEGKGLTSSPALYRSTLVASVRPRGRTDGTATLHAPHEMRVGGAVGYADGVPRALSNKGAFVVAGARAPIVGRVCMNATLIDLTDIPAARPGSAVTLIGRDGDAEVTADDWAEWAETINYEIVARLPSGLPRNVDATDPP